MEIKLQKLQKLSSCALVQQPASAEPGSEPSTQNETNASRLVHRLDVSNEAAAASVLRGTRSEREEHLGHDHLRPLP